MAIDNALSPEQQQIRNGIRAFATQHLRGARSTYEGAYATSSAHPASADPSSLKPAPAPARQWEASFRSTRPLYQAAVQAGLIKALIPAQLGGLGAGLVEAVIAVEEYYAVETSASLTILGTGLGLTPLIMAWDARFEEGFLRPFLRADGTEEEGGCPLASLVFSEPGGSANFAEVGGEGLRTVAVEERGEWVISGEKIWATNCSGWDDRGADLQCVVCRVVEANGLAESGHNDPRSQTAIVMVTRRDIANNKPEAYQVVEHMSTLGHTAVNGPHIRFTNLRVPKANMLASPGKGADVVETTFTMSATLVSAMGVGMMRQAFEYALAWAKTNTRGSNETMIQKQSVQDLLIKIKTRCEAARALTWKSATAFGRSPYAAELCYEAKIFGSESAVKSIQDAINLVGVSAYSKAMPLANLLNDAMVLPIFDGGNVGVRRRQIAAIFAKDDYHPWEATFGSEEATNDVNGK